MKTQTVIINQFKKLENIEFQFNGNHVLLMGDNGVGKSSVQQFIEIALGKQSNLPPNASGSGEVILNKDGKEIKVKVTFKDGKPVLRVSGNGISIDNKKGAIAELFGAVNFDIDEFVNLSKTDAGRKKQVEIFKGFLPKETREELAKFEANVQNAYNERTDLNRMIAQKDASIKAHRLYAVAGVKKFVYTDMKEVIAKLDAMQEVNKKRDNVVDRLNAREKQIENTRAKIKELGEILEADLKLQKDAEAWLKENQGHKAEEVESVKKELEDVEKNNRDFNDSAALLKDIEALKVMQEEAGELTAKVASSKEAIKQTIQQMDGPIDGLTFDDDQLVYNSIPVHPASLSTSEIRLLGARLKIAENPEALLLINGGESIGEDKRKELVELADGVGAQIIMEQVESGAKTLHFEIMAE